MKRKTAPTKRVVKKRPLPVPKGRKKSAEEYAREQLRSLVKGVQERRAKKRIDPPAFEEAFGDIPRMPLVSDESEVAYNKLLFSDGTGKIGTATTHWFGCGETGEAKHAGCKEAQAKDPVWDLLHPLSPLEEMSRAWWREESPLKNRTDEIIKAKAEFAGRPGTYKRPSLWRRFINYITS